LSTAYAKLGNLDLVAQTQAKIRQLHLESKSSYVTEQQDLLNKIVALTSGIQADPSASSLYLQRAETFQNLEAYQQAIEDYTKAMGLDSKSTDLRFLRASAYAELKQYDKAIADYTESIKQSPDGAAAFVNRGLCYKDLKQYDDALADFEIAVAHNPDDLTAIDNLGSMYSTLGDHEMALARFEQSFRFNDDADRYLNRGMEYLALGNYEKANADFDSALSRSPNSTSAKYQHAKALYKLGKFGSAVTELNQCLSYQPFDADTYALLGSCYTAQGKMKDAVSAFDHSIQIKPDCGPAHYGRAIMYEKLGMTDQAKKERSAATKLGCTAEA
jgi:tetratricopeptide (TPR) repeat protein